MKVLWIFVVMLVFCIYILLGLHINEGLDSTIQITLSWIIYTLLWLTFINVYAFFVEMISADFKTFKI